MLAQRADGELKLSKADLENRDSIAYALAYLTVSLCATILVIIALLSFHSASRPKLDRVSFRMLTYALVGSLLYGVTVIFATGEAYYRTCPIVGSVLVFTLHLSSFLFFCIGLNLQLVMVHGIDGQKAEKFYVTGSFLLAVIVGLVCVVSKQWTYNPELKMCWSHSHDPKTTILWQMGTLYLWNFLTMIGELITFCSILVYMVQLKVFESDFIRRRSQHTSSRSGQLSASLQYSKPTGPKQYRNMVLRIALYPLSSLATLGIISVGNTYLSIRGVHSRADVGVLFGTRIVYVSRGAIYALIAFMDPAIWRAFKSLYSHFRRKSTQSRADHGFEFIQVAYSNHSETGTRQQDEIVAPSTERSAFEEYQSSVALPSRPNKVVTDAGTSRTSHNDYPPGRYVTTDESMGTDREDQQYLELLERRL